MIKEVFFIRHSKPGKCCPLYKWFSLQKQNEKKRLTNEGKLLAEKVFQNEMLTFHFEILFLPITFLHLLVFFSHFVFAN